MIDRATLEAAADAAIVTLALQARQRAQPFVDWLRGVHIEDATSQRIIPMEPWPHLIERATAWQSGASEDILKARQEGFSWLAASYAVYTARKANSRVLLLSQGERDAYELLRKTRFVADHHSTPVMLTRANAGELEIAHGGTIRALPSTEHAGRGYTATLVIVDEAAYHPYAEQNYQAYYPTVADGGQLIIISTSNGPQGWFYHRYQQSQAPVFVPWSARPDRDVEWYSRTMRDMGEDAFMREYPATQDEAFAASSGLALAFDARRHVRDTHPIPWDQCSIRIAGFDPGGDDPTAVVVLGAYRKDGGPLRWHQFAELYQTGTVSIDDIVSFLYEWNIKRLVGDMGPQSPYVGQFRRMGIEAYGAKKNREVQWRKHAEVLRDNRLTIFSGCQSIAEYYSYWWDDKSQVPFATKTGEGHHADGIQAREYPIVWAEAALHRGELGNASGLQVRYAKRDGANNTPSVRYASRR